MRDRHDGVVRVGSVSSVGSNMNRKVFFAAIRKSLFDGSLNKGQVEGIERILDYWQANWPAMSIEELAYVLATVKWETGHTFQPVREKGGESARYAPFYGRGLVQITWAANYAKFGIEATPDKALEWSTALAILFEGMIKGSFTGKKLADYISTERHDYVDARAIVNGSDQAIQIAIYADKFLAALKAGAAAPAEEDTARTTSSVVKAGAGGAAGAGVVIAGQHAASGGDPLLSALMAIGSLVLGAAPWIMERFKKSPAPIAEATTPAPKPPPVEESSTPSVLPTSLTTDLETAMAKARACKAALDDALEGVAKERQKIHARIETQQAADLAAANEVTAIKESVAEPKRLAAPEVIVPAAPVATPAVASAAHVGEA